MTKPEVRVVLEDNWRVFQEHRPVGAYLPVGQEDGDCMTCHTPFPCVKVLEVFDELQDRINRVHDLATMLATTEPTLRGQTVEEARWSAGLAVLHALEKPRTILL